MGFEAVLVELIGLASLKGHFIQDDEACCLGLFLKFKPNIVLWAPVAVTNASCNSQNSTDIS